MLFGYFCFIYLTSLEFFCKLTSINQKGVMYMKFRKTRTAARSVYIYRFADGTVAVLHPGEQGVSTEIINFLHRLDDREVYRNLKQIKVKKYFTEPVDARESLEIQRLHEVVSSLTPKQQDTYRRVVVEGSPMTQVAREEGVSETAIRHRMEKIKAQIKKKF
jgi:hypothetical protein